MSRTAKFPVKGYSRPRRASATSLVVDVVGESGESLGRFDFSDLAVPEELLVDLVSAFEIATGSSGRWRAESSVRRGAEILRRFAREMAVADVKRMSDFKPEVWWAWRKVNIANSRSRSYVIAVKSLLHDVRVLPATTRSAMKVREKKARDRLYGAYSVKEFRSIYATAWSVVRAAKRRLRRNQIFLKEYRLGTEPKNAPSIFINKEKWTRGRVLDHIDTTGTFPSGKVPDYHKEKIQAMLGLEKHSSGTLAIFASSLEVYAGIVLLVCERGFNLSVVEKLTVSPQIAGNDKHKATVHAIDKPRRGPSKRYSSVTFSGKSSRIREVITEITEPARQARSRWDQQCDRLLIGFTTMGKSKDGKFKLRWIQSSYLSTSFHDLTGIVGDDGTPLKISLRRLRLTEQVVNKRSSLNSEEVSESIYRGPDKQTKAAAQGVILKGQEDALADARVTVAVKLLTIEEVIKAKADPSIIAQRFNVSTSKILQLLNGDSDTVASACIDIKNGPYAEKGDTCGASFLLCLSCPNSVVTPKHLPRLILLFDAISERASIVTEAVWIADYATAHQQLSNLLEMYATREELVEARNLANEDEKQLIHNFMRGYFEYG